jgi:hypothetical protein
MVECIFQTTHIAPYSLFDDLIFDFFQEKFKDKIKPYEFPFMFKISGLTFEEAFETKEYYIEYQNEKIKINVWEIIHDF